MEFVFVFLSLWTDFNLRNSKQVNCDKQKRTFFFRKSSENIPINFVRKFFQKTFLSNSYDKKRFTYRTYLYIESTW